MKALRIVLLLLAAHVALAQQPTISFSGVAIDAASNRPLPRATLELRPAGATDPTQAYPGLSNETGQFTFRNIPPGTYTLTAARNGYVRTEYGQRGPNGKGTPLTLAVNQQPPAIRMTLTQSGAISGRIMDPSGLPYPYVQITARRLQHIGGLQTFGGTSAAYTNDLGEYRLWNLPPGQYQISAEVNTGTQRIQPATATMIPPLPGGIVVDPITRGSMNAVPDPANVNVRRNATTLGGPKAPIYYKNTTNDRLATLIDLKPGNDLSGIDFVAGTTTMIPTTINVPAGTTQMQLSISPSQINVSVNFRPGIAVPSFQFAVPPGSYTVAGQGRDSGNNTFVGYGSVEVNALNPAALNLNVSTPLEVSGRIAVEGQADNPDTSKLRIRLRRNPVLVGIPELSITPAAGTFSKSQALPPGEYFVEVSGYAGTLGGAFVKSIRVKDAALSGNTIQIGGEAITGLEILLGTRGGQLEGNAISPGGEVWSNVVVALIPDQRSRYDLYKTITTDASGHFRFDGIAPGAYKLFSWEDVEADAWLIPDFVRSQEDRGKALQVGEGARERVDAAIIPYR